MTADKKKKPSAGFWIAVALVVALVAYPLSFGPACWISERTGIGTSALSLTYQPMLRIWMRRDRAGSTVNWYARLGMRTGLCAISKSKPDGWLTIGWQGMM